MKIVCNRLLSIFLSFLMLFTMPTFADDSEKALNPAVKTIPWRAIGIGSAVIGTFGMLGSGITVAVSGGKWELPYCNTTSEYPNLIEKDIYPSCPNCSVHFEANCYNGTNCHANASEQVCANNDDSQTITPFYQVNPSYIILFTSAAFTIFMFCIFNVACRACSSSGS